MKNYKIPIVLIVFNRVDLVERQLKILEQIAPEKLFVVCDAPRQGNDEDTRAVAMIKSMIDNVAWTSDIKKNYAMYNMGCDKRISSGLDWVFRYVDEAIVLEDDCMPSEDFFYYCEEVLNRYADDKKLYYVSGSNEIPAFKMKNSYSFIPKASTWGWATWKQAWDTFDYGEFLECWEDEKRNGNKWRWAIPGEKRRLIKIMDRHKMEGIIPWDYCWTWHVMKNNGLSIVPEKNMIENVGFRIDATHTSVRPEKYVGTVEKMEFPLKHPSEVKFDKRYYLANWKYEKPNYLKKLLEIDFYKRQWKRFWRYLKRE